MAMKRDEIMQFYKEGSIDSLLPVLLWIQKIDDNQEQYLKEYFIISFIIDLLSGVDLRIDKKRIFMQTAYSESQLADAVYNGCLAFSEWFEINKK